MLLGQPLDSLESCHPPERVQGKTGQGRCWVGRAEGKWVGGSFSSQRRLSIFREWIFGFLQADTSAFIGLGCTGGDPRPLLCPAAPIAPPVSATPLPLGCTRVLAHAPPGRVHLPPQHVGAALLLLTHGTAGSQPACDMQPLSPLTSPLGSPGVPNAASLTLPGLRAHRHRRRQLSNCIRPTFAAFSLPQLDFI